MKRLVAASLLAVSLSTPALAGGLRVSPARLTTGAAPAVEADVSWDDAWRNERNHDAVWLFVKLARGGRREHARLAPAGHAITPLAGGAAGALEVAEDRAGAFCVAAGAHRGAMRVHVRLALDPEDLGEADPKEKLDAAVYGLEMVLVPEGPFTLGDPDPKALDYGAVYKAGVGGVPDGPYRVASEKPIEVGAYRGLLDYRVRDPRYQGDRRGPIPEPFPKGYRAFWLMKYELTQGEYAAFLNALDGEQAAMRAIHGGKEYASSRGSIILEKGVYVARAPERPSNFVSWDDGCAFADWAALRPYTELEFEKASRGPGQPLANEFPWGTGSKERLKRKVRPDDDLERGGDADESRLTDATKDVLGASYWWVMDLAGSVWEKVVTFGHPAGRSFRGTHGDGRLDPLGFATNEDWPKGDVGRGGYGYRGGGYYEHGMKETEFNPWSPIAYRRFGSWGDAPRTLAYGFRAARTRVEQNRGGAR